MMWKNLIFLAFASVVLAGKIKKNQASYEFYIKHDYEYLKHHHKLEHPEYKKEHDHHEEVEVQQEENQQEQQEEEVQQEENNEEQQEQPQEEQGQEQEQEQQQEQGQGQEEEQQQEQEPEQEQGQEQQEENTEEEQQQGNEEENSNTETQESDYNKEHDHYPTYEFSYKVEDYHTHDLKGQHEKKYGDKVKGAYWLVQPDGYKRTVEYHADKHSGFHANVDYTKNEEHYEGEDKPKPKSEYYVSTYHGLKKSIPDKVEHGEDEEQDKQEESAQNIPIYVI